MKVLQKIDPTEKLLQVHYYQFFNSLPFCLNSDYDIDIIGINEKYPGFLETFDFANVDVYDLNKFIRIKTRLTHWYSDPNELSNSDFSCINPPKCFFCFWKKDIDDLLNIGEFEKFPLLFTDYKSSPFNDLIKVNYYDTICVYNQNGEYLNISESPNLYDDGWSKLTFLNKEYFVISLYDDNNLDNMKLFKYVEGNIESHVDIDSFELINLLDENRIIWKIENLSEKLRDNKTIILNSLKSDFLKFSDINSLFKKDKEIVLKAVKLWGNNLEYAGSTLRGDKEVVLAAVKSYGKSLEYASDSLKSDKEVVLVAVKSYGKALEFAGVSMKSDKEIVLAAVRSEGEALKYADDLLKSDREIILATLKSYGWKLENSNLFKYTTDESLLKDRDFILEAVKLNPHILKYVSEAFKSDREIVLEAIKYEGSALEYASAFLQADKKLVLEAIKFDGCAIKFASTSLQDDKEVVLAAVKSNGSALYYANKRFTSDRKIVLQAVKDNGFTLAVADDLFKADKDLVLCAVKSKGLALEFASASLQKDKDVVLAAFKEDYRSFKYCSELLLSDEEFINKAYKLNYRIMHIIDAKKICQHNNLQKLYDDFLSRKENEFLSEPVAHPFIIDEEQAEDDLPF